MRQTTHALCCAVLAACAGGSVAAPELACRAAPPNANPAVVELFTSEGCESCPPAEKLFSSLDADADLAPLVWHVAYFDRLGWKDRYALPASEARQRKLLDGQPKPTLLTPQVFIGGAVFDGWRDSRAFRSKAGRSLSLRGNEKIDLKITGIEGDVIRFDIGTQASAPPRIAWAALTQGNLSSQVTAGENSGKLLQHEHVVRAVFGPVPVDRPASPTTGELALPPGSADRRFRLTAWIQDGESRVRAATWLACTAP
jgi:hypothetical protein